MAYKRRRVKKKPVYKKPVFWTVAVMLLLVIVLVAWVLLALLGGKPLIRTPDPTTEPTSGTRPQEETRETLPPPPENPYGPIDFDLVDEETNEITLTSGNAIKGIDVSEWQGDIDWQQVKDSGVEYVIIRVGGRGTEEGTLYGDDRCQEYYAGATAVGLKVGAYIFAQSITVEEAVEEAEFVLEQVKDWDVQMPLVYDWEYVDQYARTADMDSRTLTDMAKAFCERIRDAGYTPMLYFGRSQSVDLLNLEELVDYPFWLAMYTTIMDYPYKVDMWQYTDTGSVPGISGNVDLNLWFTYEE